MSTLTPPELQIFVRREEPKKLCFEVRSDHLGHQAKSVGCVSLEGDPKVQAQEELGRRMDSLSDLVKTKEGQESAEHQLADMGVTLFRQLPEGLRELLWSLQDRIRSVQILSDEPYIPWEVLKLQGEEGEEGPFLCEAYQVTRWLREVPLHRVELPLRKLALVFPQQSPLLSSQREKEDLSTLAGAERTIEIEPRFAEVKKALAVGDYDGWHFCGHGSARAADPNRAGFWLDDGIPLTPENLGTAKGNFRRRQPLVFLNACDTARSGFSLTEIGGWAQQSLTAGAGAFIGTLWPVRDQAARSFARTFYQSFLDGEPLGEAVRRARLQVRGEFPGNPAWLAYTVYGHPGAVCSSSAETGLRRISQARASKPEERQEFSPVEVEGRRPESPRTVSRAVAPGPSSNLRIKPHFTDLNRDLFVERAFELIAQFFEGSLAELERQNPSVRTNFHRVDGDHFKATIYVDGKRRPCRIWRSRGFFGDIAYAADDSGADNSCNESLSVEESDDALRLRSLLGFHFSASARQLFDESEAAEYLWSLLIQPLQ